MVKSSKKEKARTERTQELKYRVLVVDDHPIVLEGLTQLIDREPDLQVCCGAQNSASALQAAAEYSPHLAIVDLNLESSSGISLIESMASSFPHIPILVLSMYDECVYAERCLKTGARGYIMKQEPSRKMLDAIRKVLSGEVYLSENLRETMLARFIGKEPVSDASPVEMLSNRELEVYQLLGKGLKNQEIANILHISPKTVDTYIEHIKRKLNFRSLREMLLHSITFYNSTIK